MTLTTEWQTRISTDRQVQLTNPDDRTAVAVNAARLAAAVADAKADFTMMTNLTLDDATPNAQHIQAGILGVTYYLTIYHGLPGSSESTKAKEAWERAVARLAKLSPQTSSPLTPSRVDTSTPVRPDFDRENLSGIAPNTPRVTGRSD